MPDLATRLRAFAAARDWDRVHTPKNLLMALAGEVGELVAELQWLSEPEADPRAWDAGLRERVSDEVADVLIYLVRFADVCGIDPLTAASAKVGRNESRFPPSTSAATTVSQQEEEPEPRANGPDVETGSAVLPDVRQHL